MDKASGTDIGARAARWAALGRRLLHLAVVLGLEAGAAAGERRNLTARVQRTASGSFSGEAFYEGGWGPLMSGLADATARDLAEWAPKADSIAKELASRRRAWDDHEWTQSVVRTCAVLRRG